MSDAGTKFTYRITAEGVDAVKMAFGELTRAIGAAAGIGGLGYMIENSLKTATNIELMSREAGMSTKAFQEWSYTLQKFGIDQQTASTEMAKFNVAAAQFVTQNAGPGKTAFERLGFSQADVQKGMQNADQFFGTVLGKIGQLKSEAEKLELLKAIFGKGAYDLIGPADAGLAAMRAYREEAERLGIVMSDDVVKSAHEAENRINTLTDILHMKLAVAIDENADKLAHMAQVGIDMLPTLVSLIDDVATGLQDTAHYLKEIADGDFSGFISHLSQGLSASMAATVMPGAVNPSGMSTGYLVNNPSSQAGYSDLGNMAFGGRNPQLGEGQDFYSMMGLKAPQAQKPLSPPGGILPIGDNAATAAAQREADAYAKLVQNLKDETAAMGISERAMFIATEQRKLGLKATQDQKDGIAQLAGALYDEKQHWEEIKQASTTAATDIGNAFENMALHGAKFGDSMKSLAKDLLNVIYKLTVIDPLEKSLASAFEGGGSSGIGGIFSAISGAIFGGTGFGGGSSSGGATLTGGAQAAGTAVDFSQGIPSFAVGTDYVPYDMVAQIHKGEQIVPASQNKGGKQTSNVFHITMGGGVSPDEFAQLEAIVHKVNGSIETRAVSAVAEMSRRSTTFLRP